VELSDDLSEAPLDPVHEALDAPRDPEHAFGHAVDPRTGDVARRFAGNHQRCESVARSGEQVGPANGEDERQE